MDTIIDILKDEILKNVLEVVLRRGKGHIGTYLSSCNMLAGLYFGGGFNYDPENPENEYRDRFVSSKAHLGLILYATLAKAGFFSFREVADIYAEPMSRFPVVPTKELTPGVDMTIDFLGGGLGKGLGLAIAAKKKQRRGKIVVYIGDGESSEGSVRESMEIAGNRELDLNNLIAVVDKNNYSLEKEITTYAHRHMAELWRSYGFNVIEIDGCNSREMVVAMRQLQEFQEFPTLIISNTIKGGDIEKLVNDPRVHYFRPELHTVAIQEKLMQLEKNLAVRSNVNVASYIDDLLRKMRANLNERAQLQSVEKINTIFVSSTKNIPLTEKPLDLVKQVFEPWLEEVGSRDSRIIALSGDVGPSVGMSTFQNRVGNFSRENPGGRYISLPVVERSMIQIADGLTREGFLTIFGMYEPFVEFTIADAVAMLKCNLPFVWITTHAGLSCADGRAYEEFYASSFIKHLPNIIFMEPNSPRETRFLLNEVVGSYGKESVKAFYMRLSKQPVPDISEVSLEDFKAGFYEIGRVNNPDVILVTMGAITHEVLKAQVILSKLKVKTQIIAINNIEKLTLNKEAFVSRLCASNAYIFTIYDGDKDFLKELTLSLINDTPGLVKNPVGKIIGIGLEEYGESGNWTDLTEYFGLSAKWLATTIVDYYFTDASPLKKIKVLNAWLLGNGFIEIPIEDEITVYKIFLGVLFENELSKSTDTCDYSTLVNTVDSANTANLQPNSLAEANIRLKYRILAKNFRSGTIHQRIFGQLLNIVFNDSKLIDSVFSFDLEDAIHRLEKITLFGDKETLVRAAYQPLFQVLDISGKEIASELEEFVNVKREHIGKFLAVANLFTKPQKIKNPKVSVQRELQALMKNAPSKESIEFIARVLDKPQKLVIFLDNFGEVRIILEYLKLQIENYEKLDPNNVSEWQIGLVAKKGTVENDITSSYILNILEEPQYRIFNRYIENGRLVIFIDGPDTKGFRIYTLSREIKRYLLEVQHRNGYALIFGVANFVCSTSLNMNRFNFFVQKSMFVEQVYNLPKDSIQIIHRPQHKALSNS